MIQPINNYVLIEPLKQESFIESHKSTFEEIGVVLGASWAISGGNNGPTNQKKASGEIYVGSKVYFDAWLASKFPTEKEGDFYWLVKYEDIKAVDNGD